MEEEVKQTDLKKVGVFEGGQNVVTSDRGNIYVEFTGDIYQAAPGEKIYHDTKRLTRCDVIICGQPINITPLLTMEQREDLIDLAPPFSWVNNNFFNHDKI